MRDISENTVSARNQLPRSSSVFYLGDENAKKRVLIVGNSITRHAPSAGIGWHGDWGMAASSADKDYVHRLAEALKNDGFDILTKVHQLATWERGHSEENALDALNDDRDFDADVVVFRLGENVRELDSFEEHLDRFIAHICPHGKVVFTTTVWHSEAINGAIRAVASRRGETVVDITAVGKTDKYMALGQFEHKGVAMHPSDEGMKYIADEILPHLKAILEN